VSSAIVGTVDIHSASAHSTHRGYTRQPGPLIRCISSGYDDAVKETHTPHRPIRVEDELWEEFGILVGARHRSAVVRDFIAWYTHRKGAKMPKRLSLAETLTKIAEAHGATVEQRGEYLIICDADGTNARVRHVKR
jgi:hypothetical protein